MLRRDIRTRFIIGLLVLVAIAEASDSFFPPTWRNKRITFVGDSTMEQLFRIVRSAAIDDGFEVIDRNDGLSEREKRAQLMMTEKAIERFRVPRLNVTIEWMDMCTLRLSNELIPGPERQVRQDQMYCTVEHLANSPAPSLLEIVAARSSSLIVNVGVHLNGFSGAYEAMETMRAIASVLNSFESADRRHSYMLTPPQHFLTRDYSLASAEAAGQRQRDAAISGTYILSDVKMYVYLGASKAGALHENGCFRGKVRRHWTDILAQSVMREMNVSTIDLYPSLIDFGWAKRGRRPHGNRVDDCKARYTSAQRAQDCPGPPNDGCVADCTHFALDDPDVAHALKEILRVVLLNILN